MPLETLLKFVVKPSFKPQPRNFIKSSWWTVLEPWIHQCKSFYLTLDHSKVQTKFGKFLLSLTLGHVVPFSPPSDKICLLRGSLPEFSLSTQPAHVEEELVGSTARGLVELGLRLGHELGLRSSSVRLEFGLPRRILWCFYIPQQSRAGLFLEARADEKSRNTISIQATPVEPPHRRPHRRLSKQQAWSLSTEALVLCGRRRLLRPVEPRLRFSRTWIDLLSVGK